MSIFFFRDRLLLIYIFIYTNKGNLNFMIKLEWGLKRQCLGCSTRFYDLRKSPIICPECGDEYIIQGISKSKKKSSEIHDDVIILDIEDDDETSIDEDLDDDSDDDNIADVIDVVDSDENDDS